MSEQFTLERAFIVNLNTFVSVSNFDHFLCKQANLILVWF